MNAFNWIKNCDWNQETGNLLGEQICIFKWFQASRARCNHSVNQFLLASFFLRRLLIFPSPRHLDSSQHFNWAWIKEADKESQPRSLSQTHSIHLCSSSDEVNVNACDYQQPTSKAEEDEAEVDCGRGRICMKNAITWNNRNEDNSKITSRNFLLHSECIRSK